MIARVLGAPFGLWIGQKLDYDGFYDLLAFSAVEQMVVKTGQAPIPVDHPHFPYGVEVLPD